MSIRVSGVSACAVIALVAGLAQGGIVVRTIALTGTDGLMGPGMGAGVTFDGIGQQQPSVTSAGRVAFRANASVGGSPQGVWIHGGSSNSVVALAGGAMPGGGTYTSGSTAIFNSMQVNDSGDWAMRLGASTGLFATSSGTPSRVLLGGDTAPGTGGATYASSASGMPLFNNAGVVGYIGNLTSGTGTPPVAVSGATANAQGLWTGTPGATTLAMRQNDTVAAIDPGGSVRVGSASNLTLSMNGSGRFAVQSALQGTVTTGTGAGSNSVAVLSNRGGTLEVIARTGNAAPDATGAPHASDLFRSFSGSAIALNDAGRVGFVSSLRNAAGTQTASSALFTDTGSGTLRMIGRTGDAVPAVGNANGAEFVGTTWSSFSNVVLNGGDSMLFTTTLGNTGGTGNTNVMMTMTPGGALSKVVRSADVAIPGGAPLGGDAFFTSFSNPSLNAAGQVAFSATLNGSGIFGGPGGNNSAMFAWDPASGLCLLARTGDAFEVAPGDFRTVSSLGGLVSSGGQDGRVRSLSDSGMVAFALEFTDGSSGVFLAAVPAPGVGAAMGLLGLLASRRRRASVI
jgi:hypothetical protein